MEEVEEEDSSGEGLLPGVLAPTAMEDMRATGTPISGVDAGIRSHSVAISHGFLAGGGRCHTQPNMLEPSHSQGGIRGVSSMPGRGEQHIRPEEPRLRRNSQERSEASEDPVARQQARFLRPARLTAFGFGSSAVMVEHPQNGMFSEPSVETVENEIERSAGGDSNAIWNGSSGLVLDAADGGVRVAVVSLGGCRLRIPSAMGGAIGGRGTPVPQGSGSVS